MALAPDLALDLDTARRRLAAEWEDRQPQTPDDIAAFYRDAQGLRADLNAWHATPERQEWTTVVRAAALTARALFILDVGAGAGHDLRALRQDNPQALLHAIEPNDVLREELRDVTDMVWSDLLTYEPVIPVMDMITCLDVLEHVPDPESLLLACIGRLRMNGILVEATATHDLGTPLHLPHLRGWSPARLLDRHGFVLREQRDRVRVWQRVQTERVSATHLLLCAYRAVGFETVTRITQMALAGWRYQIHGGDALVSRVRSIAVSQWLRETDSDVFLMIDDDIIFKPEDAQRVVDLAREKRGIACGAYPVRGGAHLACRPWDTTVVFGPDKPPVEIEYAATGFLAAHRDVCEAIAATLPLTHAWETWAFWPLFWPSIKGADGAAEYLSEDWAFCQRARDLGFGVWLDPRVELTHMGQAAYTVRTMPSAVPAD